MVLSFKKKSNVKIVTFSSEKRLENWGYKLADVGHLVKNMEIIWCKY